LLRDLERSMVDGDLRDSLIAPIVLTALNDENELDLAGDYDPIRVTRGIRLGDEYFVRVKPSAGQRDWQRDFAQTATPTLVGVARSLRCSPDAQALVIRLCDRVAERLRLRLIWLDDVDERNDLTNRIYSACLDATELESDQVLKELKGLTVVGPE
jgi:hypothetical protein